jgi:hypothetical protein
MTGVLVLVPPPERIRISYPASMAVTARKGDAPAADHAAMTHVAGMPSFSEGGGLIQTTSGCRQQRVLRLPPPSGKLSPVLLTTRGLKEMTSAALQRGCQS